MPRILFHHKITKGYSVYDLSESDKAWLACAIDSEGFITFPKENRRSKITYQLRIGVTNTNLDYIEKAAKLFGRNYASHFESKNATIKRTKPCYVVNVQGKDAQKILIQILPYLIIKQDKAKYGLSMQFKTNKDHLKILNSKPHQRDSKTGRFS